MAKRKKRKRYGHRKRKLRKKAKLTNSTYRGLYGLSIPEAGALIGIGRNASYEAVKRKQMPIIKIGGMKIVPKHKWLRMLGAMTK